MKDLRGMSDDLAMKFQMIKFGVDTEAEAIALRELAHLHLNYLEAVRVYKETDSLSSRQRQAEDIRDLKVIIANQQKVVDELAKRREAVQLAIGLAEKYNKLELAHARILGDQRRAAEASLAAYTEYYTSRVAAHQMALREEAKQQQIAHAEQLKLMGETTQQGIANAARIKQAYAEYYASRILGEKAAREAAEGKSVKGGRGQDPRQFTYLDEFRKQLKAQEDARTAASRASSKAAVKLKEDIIELTPEMQRIMDVSESIGQSFENAFMSAVDGSMKAKDAFRMMAADIIKELYRVFVVKQITGFITDAASLFLGPKVGAVSMGPKAIGGPVQAGGSYLVGERGPELFRPARSGSITPNDQLGGGTIVVNQTINVSTGVQQTVRTEIKSLMPQIAESAKAAVADAKRRGGSYGRAFA
jgi:phage-related minor tail protein